MPKAAMVKSSLPKDFLRKYAKVALERAHFKSIIRATASVILS